MTVTASYFYFDADGSLLRCKERHEGPGGVPRWFRWWTFRPEFFDWVEGASDRATATLYRLELLASAQSPVVWIPEGEKDVDSLCALGLVAVTSGSALSWRRHHSEQLQKHGCRLALVLPDHDARGEASAKTIARENLSLSVPIPTRIIDLGLTGEGEDVSDLLARGRTREDLIALARRTKLVTLAELPLPEPKRSSHGPCRPYDRRLNQFFFETLKIPATSRRSMLELCPFHPDVKPSLSLDLDRGLWYCFGGCGGGDLVKFYMKVHQLRGRVVLRTEAWRRLQATYL